MVAKVGWGVVGMVEMVAVVLPAAGEGPLLALCAPRCCSETIRLQLLLTELCWSGRSPAAISAAPLWQRGSSGCLQMGLPVVRAHPHQQPLCLSDGF